MNNNLFQQDIISINDLSRETLLNIVAHARNIKENPDRYHLRNKVIATCFFEASTRTRLSFESAALRLDAKILGFSDSNSTSVGAKGETLQDSIRVIASYVDLIVLRHPREGAARLAAFASEKPVINAGDGANQHPTQTLVDLFTIQECQKNLDNLHIAFVGDLKYGRTVHSLLQALALFNCRFYFVSPTSLTLPEFMGESLRRLGIKFSFHKNISEIISKVDILYMTRLQKERLIHSESHEFEQCTLMKSDLKNVKDNLRILHPLPRIQELTTDIDETPFAYYFEQAANGVCVRQALLHMILAQS